jgi:hypothetical protein
MQFAEKDEFQVHRLRRLYADCKMLGKEQNIGAHLPLFLLA